MSYEVGSAFVSILPSAKGFGANLGRELSPHMTAAGTQGAGQFSRGLAGSQSRGFMASAGGSLAKMFAGYFSAQAAADIAVGIKDYFVNAIGAASDLSETVSKSDQIFGENAAAIETWAATAAESVGLSKGAALDAAANFGNMFQQLGFGGEQAAAMSTDVVQLAADLGSFNNLPTADVSDRISAAFRGEYDSLQLLIPNINAARVEQEALAATGKTTASELTAAEKAAAVLAIVHADGAAAAGDFARTSDGLANSQKILQADLENVQAEIGTALLPIATELFNLFADEGVPIIQELAAWFIENQDAIRSFAIGMVTGGLMFIETTLRIAQGFAMMMDVGITVFDNLIRGMFSFVGAILDGAEQAFGWMPGIGPKIAEANANFDQLRDQATTGLDAIRDSADNITSGIDTAAETVGDFRARVQELDGASPTVSIILDTDLAERRLAAFKARLAIPDVVITADMRAQGGYYANRDAGGPVVAGRPYRVGEYGRPELFVPDTDGTILTQRDLAALGGGGGTSVSNHVTINEVTDPRGTALATLRHLADAGAV